MFSSLSVDIEIEDAVNKVEFNWIVSGGYIIGIKFGDATCWGTLSDVVNDCWVFVDDVNDNWGLFIIFFNSGHTLFKPWRWL
jgi:hypothetical protein